MLQAGIVPDAGTLATAGIGATDANAIAAYYKQLAAQQAVKKTSSGGGGNPSSSMTLANAKLMAEAGQFTDAVLAAFKKAGFTDEYLADTYGYDPNASNIEEGEISNESLAIYQRSIANALSAGNNETAQGIVNKIWDKLTPSQQTALNQALGQS